jgi:hypothetical protein
VVCESELGLRTSSTDAEYPVASLFKVRQDHVVCIGVRNAVVASPCEEFAHKKCDCYPRMEGEAKRRIPIETRMAEACLNAAGCAELAFISLSVSPSLACRLHASCSFL